MATDHKIDLEREPKLPFPNPSLGGFLKKSLFMGFGCFPTATHFKFSFQSSLPGERRMVIALYEKDTQLIAAWDSTQVFQEGRSDEYFQYLIENLKLPTERKDYR